MRRATRKRHEPRAATERGFASPGIELPAAAQAQLLAYAAFLEKWNRTYSLTALRDPKLAVSHHLLDSLAILPWVTAANLLDVGSGGGQPACRWRSRGRIWRSRCSTATARKTAFLQQAAIELGFEECLRGDRPGRGLRAGDAVCRDHLARLRRTGRFCRSDPPSLAPGGQWLAMKGQRPDAEIAKLPPGVR